MLNYSWISEQDSSVGPVEPGFEKVFFLLLFIVIFFVETCSIYYYSVKFRGVTLCLSMQVATV